MDQKWLTLYPITQVLTFEGGAGSMTEFNKIYSKMAIQEREDKLLLEIQKEILLLRNYIKQF